MRINPAKDRIQCSRARRFDGDDVEVPSAFIRALSHHHPGILDLSGTLWSALESMLKGQELSKLKTFEIKAVGGCIEILAPDLRQLKIEFQEETMVTWRLLERHPNLERLELDCARFEDPPAVALEPFKKLSSLSISNCFQIGWLLYCAGNDLKELELNVVHTTAVFLFLRKHRHSLETLCLRLFGEDFFPRQILQAIVEHHSTLQHLLLDGIKYCTSRGRSKTVTIHTALIMKDWAMLMPVLSRLKTLAVRPYDSPLSPRLLGLLKVELPLTSWAKA